MHDRPDPGVEARLQEHLGADHVGGDERRAAPLIERSTWVSAAKLTTASCPGTSERTSAASEMSPCTNRSRGLAETGARLARLPA